MKVGYITDSTGASTQKVRIINETMSGNYLLCKAMPMEMSRGDGSTYYADTLTGLFLKRKEEIKGIHEEEIK